MLMSSLVIQRKVFVFLILALLNQYTANSQPADPVFNLKNILPTSPDAAMLGKFGDIPIGNYTGTADVSIPIYTVEDKAANVKIPIVLRYHGSGIMVNQQASSVGLGWMLEAEGSIIKTINGIDDVSDNLVTADPS